MPGPPPADALDVVLQVRVVPPGGGPVPSPVAGVRARAAVMAVCHGPPREIRWGPAAWPAPLAALTFTAPVPGIDVPGSWRAVYLDPGEVDGDRAMAMAGTLSLILLRTGRLARAEGPPSGFAAYLDRAARVLGIGGAAPFAVPDPGRRQPASWRRLNAAGLQAWLGTQLARGPAAAGHAEDRTLRGRILAAVRDLPPLSRGLSVEDLARRLRAPSESVRDEIDGLVLARQVQGYKYEPGGPVRFLRYPPDPPQPRSRPAPGPG